MQQLTVSVHRRIKTKEFGTLNVVVEGAVLVAVLMQQAERVGVSEVLELNEAVDAVPRREERAPGQHTAGRSATQLQGEMCTC